MSSVRRGKFQNMCGWVRASMITCPMKPCLEMHGNNAVWSRKDDIWYNVQSSIPRYNKTSLTLTQALKLFYQARQALELRQEKLGLQPLIAALATR